MFAAGIIIFREMLEIVLITGIILAATRDLPGRSPWIMAGFAGGIIGSALVAFFTDVISEFAEGLGQELFNAGILAIAALFIGWTVLWMARHAREMRAHFNRVGASISRGDVPFISLSLVIALALLREGSEIVLFSYGMLASGQSVASLLTGGLIGGAAGTVLGLLIYFGLISLPAKYFLRATSTLLILLVAGMLSQSVGFLIAAGHFENLSNTMWDSSWLLTEHSVMGQTLHALLGYTARPATAQVLIYILTLGVFFMTLRVIPSFIRKTPVVATAAILISVGFFGASDAQAAKKVYSPYVEAGELELELRGSYDFDDNSAKDGAEKHKLGIGYGITDRWFSEIYGEMEKSGVNGSDHEFTAIEWENRYQVFEAGEHWLDLGLYGAYSISLESGGADKGEVKVLLAKNTQHFTNYANIILEKELGANASDGTEFGLAWSTRYRYSPMFEPGFEIHSDFGALNDSLPYDQQKHLAGPVIYGHLPGGIGYDIGYLFGLSDAAPDGELKWIFEYEVKF